MALIAAGRTNVDGAEQVDREFGHMINAFRYGCPPHGGMAPGVERTIMIFLNEPNIREVVAFPKNQHCQDLLVNCPSPVSDAQLEELLLTINLPPTEQTGSA